jgi:hypothetical protein
MEATVFLYVLSDSLLYIASHDNTVDTSEKKLPIVAALAFSLLS